MATTQEANKETFRRFCDAMTTGDSEVISKMLEELVDPDAVIGTPLPIEGTGPENPRRYSRGSSRPTPTFTPQSRI